MTKLNQTSKTAIVMSFLMMNLERWLKAIFLSLFCLLRGLYGQHSQPNKCTQAPNIVATWKFTFDIYGPF
jgi:hypothetical protein